MLEKTDRKLETPNSPRIALSHLQPPLSQERRAEILRELTSDSYRKGYALGPQRPISPDTHFHEAGNQTVGITQNKEGFTVILSPRLPDTGSLNVFMARQTATEILIQAPAYQVGLDGTVKSYTKGAYSGAPDESQRRVLDSALQKISRLRKPENR